ncbi:hydrolase [Desulfocucumis palustris]|uniref:bis(5'-nucleosyl)-tetraphosphatase (symmetrical) n=1 Tax=Desulfocucumis palustris TaxID=1898651 RepID=A0A2L2XCN2_9FIRM|nr:bis(5'-nucleosyl)-tetraphosphatase (symmetrical) YqeK [Desulfocucumis palustris]GBF31976.1 hydrolase [Desulfocucumis palustris]
MDREGIVIILKEMISEKRLAHSLGVSDTAVRLALAYGADPDLAARAGLLHDCARDMEGGELLRLAGEWGVTVSPVERRFPLLLHGPVGAAICRRRFGVCDEEVLRAVALHTTGSPGMGLLEKTVYVADKIEPGRRHPGVEALREAAVTGPDEGMLACLGHFMYYLIKRGEIIHPDMVSTWNKLSLMVGGRNF